MVKYFYLILAILVCSLLVSYFVQNHKIKSQNRIILEELNKINMISWDITLNELIESGFVDVTDIAEKPNAKIEQFIAQAKKHKSVFLRTVEVRGSDQFVLKLYYSDNLLKRIRFHETSIGDQGGAKMYENNFVKFSTEREDNVVNVYIVQSPIRTAEDRQLIYRYYDK